MAMVTAFRAQDAYQVLELVQEQIVRWCTSAPGGRDGQDDVIPAGNTLNATEVATTQAKKLLAPRKTALRTLNVPRY
ncbi:hypothetical protein JAAARDRAFT_211880 [Jaapia argillacea MUCL 33604]|uniref:Uncharacterized protein n=1 Tax=Jaapia argillacea MUCL 33604 TaxID=933084 RepID=A0A067P5Z8_9AGAM|nr:hypothetical protein JAAARDRAFT_211880 [Jaapia argillacea MUCL 33604]